MIAAAKKSGHAFEIIIADDASTDDSVEFIKKNYAAIILITHKTNGGFSKNINSGIKQAANDWVLALNSDISLEENYFMPLSKYMSDLNCFGVMGGIYDETTKQLIDAAKYPSRNGFTISGTVNYEVKNDTSSSKLPSFFLSGANALMNRKKLLLVEGFDEIYSPFYYEDVDLGIKAWRLGWKCYYETEAKCFHRTSSTIKSSFAKKEIKVIAKRNKLVLHQLHLEGWYLSIWQLLLIFNFTVRWIWLDFIFYRSFFAFIKMRGIISSRKKWWNSVLKKNKNSLSLFETIEKIKLEIPEGIREF